MKKKVIYGIAGGTGVAVAGTAGAITAVMLTKDKEEESNKDKEVSIQEMINEINELKSKHKGDANPASLMKKGLTKLDRAEIFTLFDNHIGPSLNDKEYEKILNQANDQKKIYEASDSNELQKSEAVERINNLLDDAKDIDSAWTNGMNKLNSLNNKLEDSIKQLKNEINSLNHKPKLQPGVDETTLSQKIDAKINTELSLTSQESFSFTTLQQFIDYAKVRIDNIDSETENAEVKLTNVRNAVQWYYQLINEENDKASLNLIISSLHKNIDQLVLPQEATVPSDLQSSLSQTSHSVRQYNKILQSFNSLKTSSANLNTKLELDEASTKLKAMITEAQTYNDEISAGIAKAIDLKQKQMKINEFNSKTLPSEITLDSGATVPSTKTYTQIKKEFDALKSMDISGSTIQEIQDHTANAVLLITQANTWNKLVSRNNKLLHEIQALSEARLLTIAKSTLSSKVKPTEVALDNGATAPTSIETYSQLSTKFDSIKSKVYTTSQEVQSAISELDSITTKINNLNNDVIAANNAAKNANEAALINSKKTQLNSISLPSEIQLMSGATTPTYPESWSAITSELTRIKSGTYSTISEYDAAITKANAALVKANSHNTLTENANTAYISAKLAAAKADLAGVNNLPTQNTLSPDATATHVKTWASIQTAYNNAKNGSYTTYQDVIDAKVIAEQLLQDAKNWNAEITQANDEANQKHIVAMAKSQLTSKASLPSKVTLVAGAIPIHVKTWASIQTSYDNAKNGVLDTVDKVNEAIKKVDAALIDAANWNKETEDANLAFQNLQALQTLISNIKAISNLPILQPLLPNAQNPEPGYNIQSNINEFNADRNLADTSTDLQTLQNAKIEMNDILAKFNALAGKIIAANDALRAKQVELSSVESLPIEITLDPGATLPSSVTLSYGMIKNEYDLAKNTAGNIAQLETAITQAKQAINDAKQLNSEITAANVKASSLKVQAATRRVDPTSWGFETQDFNDLKLGKLQSKHLNTKVTDHELGEGDVFNEVFENHAIALHKLRNTDPEAYWSTIGDPVIDAINDIRYSIYKAAKGDTTAVKHLKAMISQNPNFVRELKIDPSASLSGKIAVASLLKFFKTYDTDSLKVFSGVVPPGVHTIKDYDFTKLKPLLPNWQLMAWAQYRTQMIDWVGGWTGGFTSEMPSPSNPHDWKAWNDFIEASKTNPNYLKEHRGLANPPERWDLGASENLMILHHISDKDVTHGHTDRNAGNVDVEREQYKSYMTYYDAFGVAFDQLLDSHDMTGEIGHRTNVLNPESTKIGWSVTIQDYQHNAQIGSHTSDDAWSRGITLEFGLGDTTSDLNTGGLKLAGHFQIVDTKSISSHVKGFFGASPFQTAHYSMLFNDEPLKPADPRTTYGMPINNDVKLRMEAKGYVFPPYGSTYSIIGFLKQVQTPGNSGWTPEDLAEVIPVIYNHATFKPIIAGAGSIYDSIPDATMPFKFKTESIGRTISLYNILGSGNQAMFEDNNYDNWKNNLLGGTTDYSLPGGRVAGQVNSGDDIAGFPEIALTNPIFKDPGYPAPPGRPKFGQDFNHYTGPSLLNPNPTAAQSQAAPSIPQPGGQAPTMPQPSGQAPAIPQPGGQASSVPTTNPLFVADGINPSLNTKYEYASPHGVLWFRKSRTTGVIEQLIVNRWTPAPPTPGMAFISNPVKYGLPSAVFKASEGIATTTGNPILSPQIPRSRSARSSTVASIDVDDESSAIDDLDHIYFSF
ncbi:MAG: hypothetical protein NC236_02365 [Mycoplasma sp.]|nr:hypothetical protein [Mycoplasma sp.]